MSCEDVSDMTMLREHEREVGTVGCASLLLRRASGLLVYTHATGIFLLCRHVVLFLG